MPDARTDLVIQISASARETPDAAVQSNDTPLIQELRQCLHPGVEIALVFRNYMAITSILWLSDLQPDGSVRAGVRLLAVSGRADRSTASPARNDNQQTVAIVAAADSVLSHSV